MYKTYIYNVKIFICINLFFYTYTTIGSMEQIFTHIYQNHLWSGGGKETVSGGGSTLNSTSFIRKIIPVILKKYNIKSMLDIPCGDFNWMKTIDFSNITYIGADIVLPLIKNNNKKYGNENRTFLHLDVTKDLLPVCDIILCRDLFLHIPFRDIIKAITNFKQSGAKYLLVDTYFAIKENKDKEADNGWRPLNLKIEPFNLPEPIETIKENVHQKLQKHLALWNLGDIKV
ncbi:class I SAM-dependent methyltransferase [Candidatus Dependentiae bacterium]